MTATIDGPRLAAKSGRTLQLVVFLHGYGADGRDLIELGRSWQGRLPDAAFVAPNAPEPCAQAPAGRQWFALTMRDPRERWIGVNKAAPVLDAFLDAELARHEVGAENLVLVGFSQGTMMALHVGLRRRLPPAGILGYSGVLVGADQLPSLPKENGVYQPAPLLLIHGSEDDVIPPEALFDSSEQLAGASFPCQWHLSAGIGHGIDEAGLAIGGSFVAGCLGLRPRKPA